MRFSDRKKLSSAHKQKKSPGKIAPCRLDLEEVTFVLFSDCEQFGTVFTLVRA
jgi:hypothetical protein